MTDRSANLRRQTQPHAAFALLVILCGSSEASTNHRGCLADSYIPQKWRGGIDLHHQPSMRVLILVFTGPPTSETDQKRTILHKQAISALAY